MVTTFKKGLIWFHFGTPCTQYISKVRSPSSWLLLFVLCTPLQESIGGVARQYKQNKKASVREKYKMAQALSDRLKRIMEDVSIYTLLRIFKILLSIQSVRKKSLFFLYFMFLQLLCLRPRSVYNPLKIETRCNAARSK